MISFRLTTIAFSINLLLNCKPLIAQQNRFDKSILSLNAIDQDTEFNLQIWENKTDFLHRTVNITCTKGCATRNVAVFDDFSAGLAGALTLGDEFVLIWYVADGMFVSVYHLGRNSIKKVLEATTRSTWPIVTEVRGKRAIILGDRTVGETIRSGPDPSHAVRGKLWVWNGSAYAASDK